MHIKIEYMGKSPKTKEDIEELVLVCSKIREHREATGISQENFALQCGISKTHYGEIERNRINPTALTLIQISQALDVEVGDLFPSKEELYKTQMNRNK